MLLNSKTASGIFSLPSAMLKTAFVKKGSSILKPCLTVYEQLVLKLLSRLDKKSSYIPSISDSERSKPSMNGIDKDEGNVRIVSRQRKLD